MVHSENLSVFIKKNVIYNQFIFITLNSNRPVFCNNFLKFR